MLMLKYLLMTGGLGMIVAAMSILTYDLYREVAYRRALAKAGTMPLCWSPLRYCGTARRWLALIGLKRPAKPWNVKLR